MFITKIKNRMLSFQRIFQFFSNHLQISLYIEPSILLFLFTAWFKTVVPSIFIPLVGWVVLVPDLAAGACLPVGRRRERAGNSSVPIWMGRGGGGRAEWSRALQMQMLRGAAWLQSRCKVGCRAGLSPDPTCRLVRRWNNLDAWEQTWPGPTVWAVAWLRLDPAVRKFHCSTSAKFSNLWWSLQASSMGWIWLAVQRLSTPDLRWFSF